MTVAEFVQTKAKAVTAFVVTALAPVLAFYNVNQNVTLKQVVGALVAGVVGGAVVHTVPNKTKG